METTSLANILDGKLASEAILNDVRFKIDNHIKSESRYTMAKPTMAILLVGNNPASESYVKGKIKACERAGIDAQLFRYDESISAYDLLFEVKQFNKSHFDGFIVQLPLPNHIKADDIINEISAYKDIDGFHPINFGKMALGQKSMRPATAYGILKLIQFYEIETKGKHIVVIGRSNIVGKPVAIMLGNDFGIGRATVTSCDINTPKELLREETLRADIVIVAVGKPNLLTSDMVKEGSIIIDVGINRVDEKIVGDVDYEGLKEKVSMMTPVPGGVGPMTIAGLILNTYEAWNIRNDLQE